MKIYRIDFDFGSYQSFDQHFEDTSTAQELDEKLHKISVLTHCRSVAGIWTPPEVYSARPKLKRPDFWKFSLYNTFAMSSITIRKVQHFVEKSGELLPFRYKGEAFHVLNVLEYANYRIFSENVPGHLHQENIEGKIPTSIFRDTDRVYLYVAERTGNPATEFKAYVESEQMTGLTFHKTWDSNR